MRLAELYERAINWPGQTGTRRDARSSRRLLVVAGFVILVMGKMRKFGRGLGLVGLVPCSWRCCSWSASRPSLRGDARQHHGHDGSDIPSERGCWPSWRMIVPCRARAARRSCGSGTRGADTGSADRFPAILKAGRKHFCPEGIRGRPPRVQPGHRRRARSGRGLLPARLGLPGDGQDRARPGRSRSGHRVRPSAAVSLPRAGQDPNRERRLRRGPRRLRHSS